jgi:CubicO group peptidase (beta-lactamase class C family)
MARTLAVTSRAATGSGFVARLVEQRVRLGPSLACPRLIAVGPVGHPWGLGWGLQTSTAGNAFGDLSSERTFGHSGASGTVAWADPQRELLCVILTTRPWRRDRGFLLRRIGNVVQGAIE